MIIVLGFFKFDFAFNSNKNSKTPPGTHFIKEIGYYVDKNEITNFAWREFYWYTKNTQGDSMATLCLPDTNIIKSYYGKNTYNSLEEADKRLPIVGVTLEQINNYCKFRTEVVRQLKQYSGTNLSYYPIDSVTYVNSTLKNNKISKIASKVPEVIFYNNEYKVATTDNGLQSYKNYNSVFGFRCIAKY
ncbi:MAG: hypothetical protein J5I91_09430 [Bacteroidetes bacterium]|nr:hypothetical protein [Bacteroidota bacterium]